jgi:hypothetical protein
MGEVEDRERTPVRGVDPVASAMGKEGGDRIAPATLELLTVSRR